MHLKYDPLVSTLAVFSDEALCMGSIQCLRHFIDITLVSVHGQFLLLSHGQYSLLKHFTIVTLVSVYRQYSLMRHFTGYANTGLKVKTLGTGLMCALRSLKF